MIQQNNIKLSQDPLFTLDYFEDKDSKCLMDTKIHMFTDPKTTSYDSFFFFFTSRLWKMNATRTAVLVWS